jgi:hypothetical protein
MYSFHVRLAMICVLLDIIQQSIDASGQANLGGNITLLAAPWINGVYDHVLEFKSLVLINERPTSNLSLVCCLKPIISFIYYSYIGLA